MKDTTKATVNMASMKCTNGGIITVKGTTKTEGVELVFTPRSNADGNVEWFCITSTGGGSADGHFRYVPAECRKSTVPAAGS